MSKKHKKVCGALNYIKELLFLVSTFAGFTGLCFHSAFASLVGIPVFL